MRDHGRSALDHFKILPDKSLFFSRDESAFLAYREALGAAVVLGDPVGPRTAIAPLLRAFVTLTGRSGKTVVFLQAGAESLDLYRSIGLSPVRIGATAVVDLAGFDLDSHRAKPFRYALRRLRRDGFGVRHVMPPVPAPLLERLRETNDSWLKLPGRFERGFSVGRFDVESLRSTPVSFLESPGGSVAAFVNWVPSFVSGEATVDLIRRRCDAPGFALDALMAGVLLEARARGYSRFDLGLAPLASPGEAPVLHPAERILRWTFRFGGRLFGQAGLYAWKEKFRPAWVTQWLVYRGGPLAFAHACLAIRRVVRAGTQARAG